MRKIITYTSLTLISAGVLIFGYQVFSWATKGEWYGLSVLDSLFVFPMSCLPDTFCTWLLEPTSWYGIHGIASSIPTSLFLVIFGLLIFYFRKNLIPNEPQEFFGKPWHRLLNSVLYGSALIIFLIAFFSISFTSWDWKNRQVTAYNFEAGYEEAKGKEELCFFSPSYEGNQYSPEIDCGGLYSAESVLKRHLGITSNDPLGLSNSKSELNLEKYPTVKTLFVDEKIDDYDKRTKANQIINQAIRDGIFDGVRVKVTTDFEFLEFLRDVFVGIIAGLTFMALWFILLISLLYRFVLYVLYGKR